MGLNGNFPNKEFNKNQSVTVVGREGSEISRSRADKD